MLPPTAEMKELHHYDLHHLQKLRGNVFKHRHVSIMVKPIPEMKELLLYDLHHLHHGSNLGTHIIPIMIEPRLTLTALPGVTGSVA